MSEPALHPARVALGDPVGGVRQPEPLQELVDALVEFAAADPVELTLQLEVLAAGRLLVDCRELWPTTPITDRTFWGSLITSKPPTVRGARVGSAERGEDLDRGRLAGAVGAEEAEDGPRWER